MRVITALCAGTGMMLGYLSASAGEKFSWPKAASQGALQISITMPAEFGDWETYTFTCGAYLNTTAQPIWVDTADRAGFAGTVAYLRGASGGVKSYGAGRVTSGKYTDAARIEPGKALKTPEMDLRTMFGDLKPGSYQLQLVVPGDRYYLGGNHHGPDLVSKAHKFTIVAKGPRTEAIKASKPEVTSGISLEIMDKHIASDSWIVHARATLTNDGSKPIYLPHEFNELRNEAENLTSQLVWKPRDFVGYCGDGVQIMELGPGEKKEVRVNVPGARGIYRSILRVATYNPRTPPSDEEKNVCVVRSDAVQVSLKIETATERERREHK